MANDALQIEPDVEVIVGRHVPKGDGNWLLGKSAPHATRRCAAKRHRSRCRIGCHSQALDPGNRHSQHLLPTPLMVFPGKSLSALRSWLESATTERHSRPFRESSIPVESRQTPAKIIEPVGNLLSAIYFDVDVVAMKSITPMAVPTT